MVRHYERELTHNGRVYFFGPNFNHAYTYLYSVSETEWNKAWSTEWDVSWGIATSRSEYLMLSPTLHKEAEGAVDGHALLNRLIHAEHVAECRH